MCDGSIESIPEKKCFKNTLIAIDKSINKGNELIERIINKIIENDNNSTSNKKIR